MFIEERIEETGEPDDKCPSSGSSENSSLKMLETGRVSVMDGVRKGGGDRACTCWGLRLAAVAGVEIDRS